MEKILIKSTKQITGIRKSCQLAAQVLQYIKPFVQPGITTLELDQLMDSYIVDHGAKSACLGYSLPSSKTPYPRSTCISVNEIVCHGIPDTNILKNGDIVTIDITTILDGYFGDTASTFSVGDISENATHLLKVTEKCLEIGIKQVKPWNNTGEIGYNIAKYAILQGCTVVEQFCGHGVGVAFHEPPQIMHICDKWDGIIMFEGMIFTIEPMINLGGPHILIDEKDGWTVRTLDSTLSAQFEHTILVTKSGFEILTLP